MPETKPVSSDMCASHRALQEEKVGTIAGDANIRIWAGDTYANRATAAFRVSQGGSVVCSDLTISGGSIDLNGSVFKVDALGQVTCSDIQITGAGSTWGGAKIAQAHIANLTTAIITSGTFDAVRIPNLSTDKLTTGTLLVGRTQAKCTDANADQTSANETYSSGAEVRAGTGWTHTSDITKIDGGDIYTNTIRTNQIYVDADLQFKPSTNYNAIMGCNEIFYSSTKSSTYPNIVMTATAMDIVGGSGATSVTTIDGQARATLRSVAGDVYIIANDDIWLDAADDIILDAAGEIDFIGTDQGTISYLNGPDQSMYVKHNGVVKRLGLWDV